MATALIVLHIILCIMLVLVVLLQAGKGADIGAAFGGGSSQTAFGPRAGADFLTKSTAVIAVLFMLTSLSLAIISAKGSKESTIMKPQADRAVVYPQQKSGENTQKGETTKTSHQPGKVKNNNNVHIPKSTSNP